MNIEKKLITDLRGEKREALCPRIISASRATDIPAFFSEWFMNSLRRGYVKWNNPYSGGCQYVSFSSAMLIVFWSKNPLNMIQYLTEIEEAGYRYMFQYTLNDYEDENYEPALPPLSQRIDTFKKLSDIIGKEKIVWRYDPVFLTEENSPEIILERIEFIAEQIQNYTKRLIFSFADIMHYEKVRNNLREKHIKAKNFPSKDIDAFCKKLQVIGKKNGLEISVCADREDYSNYGFSKRGCIDPGHIADAFHNDIELIESLGLERFLQKSLFEESVSGPLPYTKDYGQRDGCRCIPSKDIGEYSTCRHFCVYCYANSTEKAVLNKLNEHNPYGESIIS